MARMIKPTCGHEKCLIHRFKEECVTTRFCNKSFERIIAHNYTVNEPEEIVQLWAVSYGME